MKIGHTPKGPSEDFFVLWLVVVFYFYLKILEEFHNFSNEHFTNSLRVGPKILIGHTKREKTIG